MYIIKNAMQNLIRNKGRNLMMGGIIFVIIVSVVTALMINNTAGGVINDYKERFGSEVSFVLNRQKAEVKTGNSVRVVRPDINPEDLINFGQSEYLKEAVYTAETKGNSEQLKAIDADKGAGGGPSLSSMGPDGNENTETLGRQYFHKITANKYDDFKNGLRDLTEGSRFPENENECIISQELLENSGLKIGDTITVTSALEQGGENGPGSETYTDIEWEMVIVGAYIDLTDEYGNYMMESAYTNRRNEILTTFETLGGKMQEGKRGINVEGKFYLKNPGLLEAFTEEVRAKGLSDVYDVATDEASYNQIVKPVEGLKGISLTFVIVVLVFGAVILALLASIAIRERKYEIGVLRAMGMKKLKVVTGLWTETLAITIVCLILGLGVGTLVAQPVTNVMLEQQLAAIEESQNNNFLPPGAAVSIAGRGTMSTPGGPGVNAEPLSNLDVSLGIITILQIIGIALLLSSLAGIIATRKITKYEPIQILMERN